MERTLSVATELRDWLVQEELQLRPEAVYRLLDTVRQNGWRLRLKRGDLITITAARGDVVVRGTGTSVREAASAIFEATVFGDLGPPNGSIRGSLRAEL